MTKFTPIVCFDFDGVLHSYTSGWKGAEVIPDPPVEGAIQFLQALIDTKKFAVHIYSARSGQDGIPFMRKWLLDWGLPRTYLQQITFPRSKPPAFVTIDDRVICFDGKFGTELYAAIDNFKPWNKKEV